MDSMPISANRPSFVDPGSGDGLFLRSFQPSRALHLASPVTKSKSHNPQSFEAALAEIENIVAAMEAGQLPHEQSLTAYRRGAEMLQYLQAPLPGDQQQGRILEARTLQQFCGEEHRACCS